MPGLEINSHGIPAVEAIGAYLQELLDHAETVKPDRLLEPTLAKSDFDDIYGHVARIFAGFDDPNGKKLRQYAIVETAARDIFGELIASTSIDSPDFVRVWNLFDILAILADNVDCDPPLLFWLVEELLDSQTIAGCRKVFDYLESRRERITAKYFNSTKLVILRSCNDLLRRLSRADDTPFCGRVFIFLFQVFPLGDKSSVNLRGEYHVENVTTYDETPVTAEAETPAGKTGEEDGGAEKMDVDEAATATPTGPAADQKPRTDFTALYPVFWSLQTSFSQPKKLFDPDHFSKFKAGMEATLATFQQISSQDNSRKQRQLDESRRGVKRKRDKEERELRELKEAKGTREDTKDIEDEQDELADTYNPKYLTSRDLFELEASQTSAVGHIKTSDLTFRRHFLLQALIVMEFLLSLSPKAKEKLAGTNAPNKSVTYSDQTLSNEDAAWAAKMKHDITDHIKNSNSDGPYFLRMVDTILARDKNWVRWKIESCPSIERAPISADEFVAAEEGAQRAFGQRRRRSTGNMNSFSLDFLDEEDPEEALAELKKPGRSQLSALDAFEREIADEDFEIEMPDSDASKQLAEERKASKTWRALRIVRQTNLSIFDKIDNDNDVRLIFKTADGSLLEEDEDELDAEADGVTGDAVDGDKLPSDKQAVVLVAAADDIAVAVAKSLVEQNPGVFGTVGQYTTRPSPAAATESEAAAVGGAKSYFQHLESKAFNLLLDGDEFIGFGESAGHQYGSRRKQIDVACATGKIPLVLMNYESVDAAQGNAFAARYVFLKPTGTEAIEPLLKAAGAYEADTDLQVALAEAKEVLDKLGGEGQPTFAKTIDVDDVAAAATQLGNYVYGREEATDTDQTMGGVEEAKADAGEFDEDKKKTAPKESGETTNDAAADEAKPAEPSAEEDASMADAGDDAPENAVANKE
ncbi:THO complex subunit 1 [Sporothrix schenckii 1099-18]|uniref:THO complex subunit 1 n=1 Tax=Sporothrix schenckii 1099-18 TaxID=1397361 RepID=A0A0F2LZQ4_SPOSC|nr:THO complex subunit 1 [Sporothrix schenckii 1099-18]KJR82324.1 THO complex subunit 1 [Sporothrix schenckii 1099-18]